MTELKKQLFKITKTITMNALLKERMEAELAPLMEIQNDRMQRYFDCQDDTIFGGISWEVTSSKINQIRSKYELLEEQINNGGFLTHESFQSCLFDLDGNFVTDRIVNTKYGCAFVFQQNGEPKFVSLAKKKSTLEKKGFQVKTKVRKFKMVFTGLFTKSGNKVYKDITLTSETFLESGNTIEYKTGGSWIEWCYENNFSK